MRAEFRTIEGRAMYRRHLTETLLDLPLTHSLSILVGAAYDIARRQKRIDALEFAINNIVHHGRQN